MKPGYLNVQDYGATGDGQTDDAESIQRTIRAASDPPFGVVYFPPGVYRVGSTVTVTDRQFFGCRLEGANAESVKVTPLPSLSGTDQVFVFRGGSGAFSNVGIKNMTIGYDPKVHPNAGHGVGIYLDGQCFAIFENVRCKRLHYGIWIHNQSNQAFSELNQFHQIELAYCKNGIRLEQGKGSNSLHGNDFNNCYFNVGQQQIGFNHHSGFLYNARFRLFMWGHSTEATYLHAGGNAINNIGDITYESFKIGKITGNGRFWFDGFLRGIGGINDESISREPWQKTFACTNYWKSEPYQDTGMQAGAIDAAHQSHNGQWGYFQSVKKEGVASVMLNTYRGGGQNGLFLGQSGYQEKLSEAELGLFLSGDGRMIRSYSSEPLSITAPGGVKIGNQPQQSFQLHNGEITIEGGNNRYRWRPLLTFEHCLAGRVYLIDKKNSIPCTVADVCSVRSTHATATVHEVAVPDSDRVTHFKLDFDQNTLRIGSNKTQETTALWFFQGIIQ